MLKLELRGDKPLLDQLRQYPQIAASVVGVKVAALTIKLQGHIVQDKLHGQVLNQRSGALARSIASDYTASTPIFKGTVFSSGDVKYAAIHEFGGLIPAHDIVPNKAEALAFVVGGQQVFAKVVHMPDVTMPERSFMRSGLADMAQEIVSSIKTAAVQSVAQACGQAA